MPRCTNMFIVVVVLLLAFPTAIVSQALVGEGGGEAHLSPDELVAQVHLSRQANEGWLVRLPKVTKWQVSYDVQRTSRWHWEASYRVHAEGFYNLGIVFWTPAEHIIYQYQDDQVHSLAQRSTTTRFHGASAVKLVAQQHFLLSLHDPLVSMSYLDLPLLHFLRMYSWGPWDYTLYLDPASGLVLGESFEKGRLRFDISYFYDSANTGKRFPSAVTIVRTFRSEERLQRGAYLLEFALYEDELWFPVAVYWGLEVPGDVGRVDPSMLREEESFGKLLFENFKATRVGQSALRGPYWGYPSRLSEAQE